MSGPGGATGGNNNSNNMSQFHIPMMSMVPTNLSTHGSGGGPGISSASSLAGTGLTSVVQSTGTAGNPAHSSHAPMAIHYTPQHNILQHGQLSGHIQIGSLQQSNLTSKGTVNQGFVVASGQLNLPQREIIDEGMNMSVHTMNNNNDQGDVGMNQVESSSQSEQRLKVEDALNYLDQVKYKFGNQPQVYNDFLDIMKEFKSQSIDTPGVIERVSNLFRGNPELIVGFNTFLPPGYKIEVSLSTAGHQGYVVTMQTVASPGGHLPRGGGIIQQQQTIQTVSQPTNQLSVRPAAAHSTPAHNGNTSRVVNSPPLTFSVSTLYDACPAGTAAFTHSFSSPFVQSAFPSSQSQPVEFNHAINYVNKIKHRFHGQPDKYKQFLDILHTYQKEQRNIKDGLPLAGKNLTEHEVYAQVSKLFESQEDLLQEFGQFLPDATNCQNTEMKTVIDQAKKSVKLNRETQPAPPKPTPPTKRPTPQTGPPPKKAKQLTVPTAPSISMNDMEKYGTLHEFALFDKIRCAIKCPQTYESFLRCLKLYNDEVINRVELTNLIQPILSKHTKLFSCFKGFLHASKDDEYEASVPPGPAKTDKLSEDQIMEIDFSTCKRLGASYCALPSNHNPPNCSGRTNREQSVLNDVWVSFPTWSEDSTFVNSRKTQYEEYIHRCEDERFELDVVIETNAATIRVLEYNQKKMQRMSQEEIKNFRLDDTLGGSSATIYQRAIRRLYGEKASEIIDGLKSAPSLAIPLVVRRLRAKEVEWREAQKLFNKVWRDQMDKFYLKSLDHQGITFKQSDVRTLRPKALLNEIETLVDEREESKNYQVPGQSFGAHICFAYGDRSILNDACNLLLHHVRRQSGIQKEDKRRIKQILKHFVSDLFSHKRLELSDDENDDGNVSPDEQDPSKGLQAHIEYFNVGRSNGKKNGTRRGNGGRNVSKADQEVKASAHPEDLKQAGYVRTRSDVSRRSMSKKRPSMYQKYVEARAIAASEKEKSRATRVKNDDNDKQITDKQSPAKSAGLKEPSDTIIDIESIPTLGKDLFGIDLETIGQNEIKQEVDKDEVVVDDSIGEEYLLKPKPSNGDEVQDDKDEAYVLFYANKAWYVFLRLHQILCERLNKILECAKDLIDAEIKTGTDNSQGPSYQLQLRQPKDIETENYYPTFLEMVRDLLDGNIEPGSYEDTLREMFGIHAYISFTLDKVVANAVRQLQSLVTDELSLKCLDLYHQFHKKGGAGGPFIARRIAHSQEIMYRKQAETLCENDGCIKVVIFKNQFRMLLELLPSEARSDALDENTKKALFLASILNSNSPEALKARQLMGLRPLFLERNKKCERRGRRRKHDYIAREYHQGDMPKYYCPKEPLNQNDEKAFDIDLDLLHNPERYSYMYQKDINTCNVIPPNFISIPPVVRNALLQKPVPLTSKKVMHKKVAEHKFTRFDRWYDKWCRKNISTDQSKEIETWLLSSYDKFSKGQPPGTQIHRTNLSNLERAPYRSFSKYTSS